jgi:hypothetical protein
MSECARTTLLMTRRLKIDVMINMNEFLRYVIRGCQVRSLFANAGISVRSAIPPSLLSSGHHAIHADAEVDMNAVGRAGSICRAAEDGAPDPDRRAMWLTACPVPRARSSRSHRYGGLHENLWRSGTSAVRRSSTSAPPRAAAVRRR